MNDYGLYNIKKEDEEDSQSLGSQDSYSQRSLTTQPDDEYQEDSFVTTTPSSPPPPPSPPLPTQEYQEVLFENIKRDYLRRKKNINKECCRRTVECNEHWIDFRIHENELEMAKLEKKKKYEENVRNKKSDEILTEIRKCEKAIKKISKDNRLKVYCCI